MLNISKIPKWLIINSPQARFPIKDFFPYSLCRFSILKLLLMEMQVIAKARVLAQTVCWNVEKNIVKQILSTPFYKDLRTKETPFADFFCNLPKMMGLLFLRMTSCHTPFYISKRMETETFSKFFFTHFYITLPGYDDQCCILNWLKGTNTNLNYFGSFWEHHAARTTFMTHV